MDGLIIKLLTVIKLITHFLIRTHKKMWWLVFFWEESDGNGGEPSETHLRSGQSAGYRTLWKQRDPVGYSVTVAKESQT